MKSDQRRRVLAVLAIVLAVAIQLVSAPPAGANGSQHGHRARVVAPHRVDGATRAALLGRVWARGYSSRVGTFPPCLRLGRTGRVVNLGDTEVTCTLERGDSALIFFGATCDDVVDPTVDPSFYGADAAAQRRCAVAWDRTHLARQRVTVDNHDPVDILNPCFEVVSAQQHVQMPEDNFYGISARPVTLVAHAWVAIIRGLRPGLHTIAFENTFFGEQPETFTHTVNVIRRHHG